MKQIFKEYNKRRKVVPNFFIGSDSELIGLQSEIDDALEKQFKKNRRKR